MKKKYISQIPVAIICISIGLTLLYGIISIMPYKYTLDTNNVYRVVIDKSNEIRGHIDIFEDKSTSVRIKGWIIREKNITKNVNYIILCQNVDSKNIYEIKTFMQRRDDVTEFINDGYNYNFSGFDSKIIKFLLPESGKYKIMLLYKHNENNFLVELPYSFYK